MKWNFCPTCGHRIYLHTGNTCTHVEATGHVLKVTETGWTLKHPLAERESDKLFECQILEDMMQLDRVGMPVKAGEYAIVENSNGGWSFEPADKARTQCDCDVPYDVLQAP